MRLSVTELDAFRRYRDNEDATLEDLLAYLRRETPPTTAMQAGSAWHKALELMEWDPICGLGYDATGDVETVSVDGFTFRIAADIELFLPEVTELKGEMEVETPSGLVTLVGVVDGLEANGVRDYKLSGRFDAERYVDSYQWRCYLRMFGAQRFTYEVFTAREDARSGEWLITAYDQLPFFAYPGLAADVQREVEAFARFVAAHLPERVHQPALVC